jgi:hypothetical protein
MGMKVVAGCRLPVAGYFAISIIQYSPYQVPNMLPGDESPGQHTAPIAIISS